MTNPNEELLLTEDGHPIGEVVLADNSAVQVDANPERVEENRADLLKQRASELTGEPDADAAVIQLYPGYEDSDKRKRAMAIVVSEGRSIEDAAEATGVPARTVAMWSYTGKWGELVKAEVKARHEASLMQLARKRAERRVRVAEQQLEQAAEIRDEAMAAIREKGVTMSAQSAWTAAAKTEQTLLGMSESGAVTGVDSEEKGKEKDDSGKRPLVMVFQGGGLPPMRGR